MDVGKRIREIRNYFKLSQKEFAKIIGASNQQNITNVELGRVEVGIILLQKICETYKVNANWILFGEGEMFINDSISANIAINHNGHGDIIANKEGGQNISKDVIEIEYIKKEVESLREQLRLKDEIIHLLKEKK